MRVLEKLLVKIRIFINNEYRKNRSSSDISVSPINAMCLLTIFLLSDSSLFRYVWNTARKLTTRENERINTDNYRNIPLNTRKRIPKVDRFIISRSLIPIKRRKLFINEQCSKEPGNQGGFPSHFSSHFVFFSIAGLDFDKYQGEEDGGDIMEDVLVIVPGPRLGPMIAIRNYVLLTFPCHG